MGRKCSVYNCKAGYDGEKVTVYKFPDDENERHQWISCIPNKFVKVTNYMGVCSRHWPADVVLVRKKGGRYPVPSVPPSIFDNVPDSCVPTHTSCTPRPTTKSLSSARNQPYDELSEFRSNDRLKETTFLDDFKSKFSSVGLLSCSGNLLTLQSVCRTGCVHTFSSYFTSGNDVNGFYVSFELYFQLKQLHHPSVKSTVRYWSELEEVVRFVKHYSEEGEDIKLKFIIGAIQKYNCPKNTRVYSFEDLSLAFSWYSLSRALYVVLRNYLCLPSITTLRRITQVAKNTEDMDLFTSVFRQLDPRSRGCILIIDEVYIKASLSYRGGTVFGYAEDQPEKLATTLLCIMVKCFFGSKSFLVKLIPCFALKAEFQFNIIVNVINTLEHCGASVLGLLCDNNRMNQRFFSMFNTPDPEQPWIARSPAPSSRPLFLIFDPVHIIKNIRNNWLTEKSQTIKFNHNGNPMSACWSDLKLLFEFERNHFFKLSTLTKSAIQPNNIEKQKVPLALQVFSAKTSSALKSSNIPSTTLSHTSTFIDLVLTLWKVFNTKTRYQSIHQRDPDRAVVELSDSGHRQIDILNEWTDLAQQLQPAGRPRRYSLTADTAKAIQWTCQSLISLSNHLLHVDSPYKHRYVAFGFFQQDDLEHHFAHFRMAAGNTFYITVEDVLNTHAIDKTKLMMEAEQDVIDYSQSGHSCDMCDKPLTDDELLLIDDMPDKEVSPEEKIALLYIGGYICQKHKDSPNIQGDASLYPDEVVSFTENLNRGGLQYPSESFFQLLCYMYIFFINATERSCRRRFLTIFMDFPNNLHLDVEMPKGSISRIVNIFFKRYCCRRQEGEGDKTTNKRRKIAKLTSSTASTFVVNL